MTNPEIEPGDHLRASGTEPDYRFTPANQRTYLAYVPVSPAALVGAVASGRGRT